jgi:DNA-binding MarR family transcriptional regulator
VTQLYDRALAPFGITVSQFSMLSRLNRLGPTSINALAKEMLVDRTTLTRNLRPLERDGLLTLAADPNDGRSRLLKLTAAGVKRLERARQGWQSAQKQFEQAYGAERTAALRTLLQGVVDTDLSQPIAASARAAR